MLGRRVHDLLEPQVAQVVVAHLPHIKLIAAAMVKTDKKDTMTLAKLLAVGLVPPVWVPPEHVRELRALINHRRRLISHQTQITQSWRTAPGRTATEFAPSASYGTIWRHAKRV